MKSGYMIALLATTFSVTQVGAADMSQQAVTNMGNVRGGDVKAAHGIIEKKCITCHSGKVIDAALTVKKDMIRIQQNMEKKGVRLNANEREVLGIYWKSQNPLKTGK